MSAQRSQVWKKMFTRDSVNETMTESTSSIPISSLVIPINSSPYAEPVDANDMARRRLCSPELFITEIFRLFDDASGEVMTAALYTI